jgi:hemerythrin-like domain-containing protein
MVVKLGQKKRPDTLVGRLLDCHDRIRRFSELAVRMGAAQPIEGEELRDAARDVRRYFVEALPLHVADEEQSLLPRLGGRDPELDAALERMEREHELHEPLVDELITICERLQRSTDPALESRVRLVELGAELAGELARHLEEEESIVFPAIERWLPAREQAEIVAEMAKRRGA